MPGRNFKILFLIMVVTGLACALVLAQEPDSETPEDPTSSPAHRPGLAAIPDDQARDLPPLHQELRTILIREKSKIAEIESRLAAVQDPVVALELHREMSRVKAETEVSLLEAQAADAQRNGQADLAKEIQEAVKIMKDRQDAKIEQRIEQ